MAMSEIFAMSEILRITTNYELSFDHTDTQ